MNFIEDQDVDDESQASGGSDGQFEFMDESVKQEYQRIKDDKSLPRRTDHIRNLQNKVSQVRDERERYMLLLLLLLQQQLLLLLLPGTTATTPGSPLRNPPRANGGKDNRAFIESSESLYRLFIESV